MSEFVRHVTRPEKPVASRLGRLDIELTERCDNDCIHCCINLPAGDAAARAREMPTAQVKDDPAPGSRPGLHAGALHGG